MSVEVSTLHEDCYLDSFWNWQLEPSLLANWTYGSCHCAHDGTTMCMVRDESNYQGASGSACNGPDDCMFICGELNSEGMSNCLGYQYDATTSMCTILGKWRSQGMEYPLLSDTVVCATRTPNIGSRLGLTVQMH